MWARSEKKGRRRRDRSALRARKSLSGRWWRARSRKLRPWARERRGWQPSRSGGPPRKTPCEGERSVGSKWARRGARLRWG